MATFRKSVQINSPDAFHNATGRIGVIHRRTTPDVLARTGRSALWMAGAA
jgi:hypothetical protein